MADELDLEEGNKVENVPISRFKEVSKKQAETAKARDEADEARKTAEQQRDEALKERDFHSAFADVVGNYPASKDHKDEIKVKVLAGYTIEDATVSVLNKAGKLTQAPREMESAAGGSAGTPSPAVKTKTMSQATKEELRQAIIDNDADIMEFLRTGR